MKIRKIAVAAVAPAAVAGVTLSSWAAVQATTSHPASAARVHHAPRTHHAAAAPTARAAAAPTARAAASSPAPLQAGMSAFERCVAWRESGDNPTASSSGLFGILPATWASLGYTGTGRPGLSHPAKGRVQPVVRPGRHAAVGALRRLLTGPLDQTSGQQRLRRAAMSHSAAGVISGCAGQPLIVARSCQYRS